MDHTDRPGMLGKIRPSVNPNRLAGHRSMTHGRMWRPFLVAKTRPLGDPFFAFLAFVF